MLKNVACANKVEFLYEKLQTSFWRRPSTTNCNPAVAPGISTLMQAAATADHEHPLSLKRSIKHTDEQWLNYSGRPTPDSCCATKELARSLKAPKTADQQKLKHLLR